MLSEIQRYCSRAAIIREGRLIACDSVENLSKTNARRVNVQGSLNIAGLNGIKDIRKDENSVSFLYSGDMNRLVERLAAGNVKDLSVSEPDLEEIFIHYYEGGEE